MAYEPLYAEGGERVARNTLSGETYGQRSEFSIYEDFMGDPDRWTTTILDDPASMSLGVDPSDDTAIAGEHPWVVPGVGGSNWTVEEAGGAKLSGVSDENFGVVALPLTSDTASQLIRLYYGEGGGFVPRNMQVEFRLKTKVLATTGAILSFGLSSELFDNPLDNPVHVQWRFAGDGALLADWDDATTATASQSTGVTATADDAYRVYRMDLRSSSNVVLYVDGVEVLASTTCDLRLAESYRLRPYIQVYKPEGTAVGTLELDYVRLWGARE